MKKFTTYDTLKNFMWRLGFPPMFCAGMGCIYNGNSNTLILGFIFLILGVLMPITTPAPKEKHTQIILDENNKTITINTFVSNIIRNSSSKRKVSFDEIYNIEYASPQEIMPLLYLEHFKIILNNGVCINGIPLLKTEIIYILKKHIPQITPEIIIRCKLDDFIMNVIACIWFLASVLVFFIYKNM